MKTLFLKSLAALSLTLTFACSPPLESWTGEMACPGEDIDIEIYFDFDAQSEPLGFFGFESGTGTLFLAIEDLERNGNAYEFETEFEGQDFTGQLDRDGDVLEGEIEISEGGTSIDCDAELDLKN